MKITITFLLSLFILHTYAQDSMQASGNSESAQDLSKKAANPIANMISLPVQLNWNFGVGEFDRTQSVFNFQPVIPFRLNDNWNVINRIIIPLVGNPDNAESGKSWGLGNTVVSSFFVPKAKGIFMWGIGPALSIPTSSSGQFGPNVFGIGPAVIALVTPGHWVAGVTANHTWSYRSDGDELNSFFAQYFITYNFAKGWYVNTAPVITANYAVEGDAQWFVPFGGGGGKIVKWGKQPLNIQLGLYHNAVTPGGGSASWQFRTQIVLLFPK
jgi:hypothetical protein